MDIGVIVAIAIAVIGATPGILSFINQRNKDKAEQEKVQADVADVLADAAKKLVEPLKERVSELEETVAKQECNIRDQGVLLSECQERYEKYMKMHYELCRGIKLLIEQLVQLGHEPSFNLPDGYCEEFNGASD